MPTDREGTKCTKGGQEGRCWLLVGLAYGCAPNFLLVLCVGLKLQLPPDIPAASLFRVLTSLSRLAPTLSMKTKHIFHVVSPESSTGEEVPLRNEHQSQVKVVS